jgi:hypothetical protein
VAFAVTFLLALAFALYTQHVWEDYYITYRSSKNLATGHGLVFNRGDRLHTFTSPLGVLLPAAASLLTGNSSDTAALWIFRLMGAGALGGATAFLVLLARRLAYPSVAVFFLVALLSTDAKSLDFAINGMETPFMLLFLAYAFWAHVSPGPRQRLHLGAAWAGLMWTRPDSFIYIALVAIGVWLFNQPARSGADRRQLFGLLFQAGLITVALYGPWLVWAWWYYGSPVPHTIVAKGAQGEGLALPHLLHGVWRLPYLIWRGQASAEGAFLPAYYLFPAWPGWMLPFGRVLATVSCLLWLVPGLRVEVRAASLAFYGGAAYLSFVPYYPFPWYFPTTALLAFIALAGLVAQLWEWTRSRHCSETPCRVIRGGLAAAMGAVLLGGIWLTVGVARQVKAQQRFVENGNRRAIGEWLHDHAGPGDTVFLEPLGYIGYFSGLKTYDWPGLSSREVVNAARLVGRNWVDLICYLQPTWVVMRASGEGDFDKVAPGLAGSDYKRVRDFDQRPEIQALTVPGRAMLEFDSHFVLYHLEKPTRQDADGCEISSPIGSAVLTIGSVRARLVHAPGNMIVPLPAGVRSVGGWFGFPPDVVGGAIHTAGAEFAIYWYDGKTRTKLMDRTLRPEEEPADRSLQSYRIELPGTPRDPAARLVFATTPVTTMTKDWTCWTKPEFK